jgi:lambda family phage tail tape measure protein
VALDLSGFQKPKPSEKVNEGEAFLNQLRLRLTRTQEGEAAELRARALQIEAKGYKGVATEAEQYIQVLEAVERQKEKDKAFEVYEKEEAAARKVIDNLIGANRQRIEAAQLQRQMLDLHADDRTQLQARVELERAAANARKEANQIQDPGLRTQTIEAINDALARQLPILEDLVRANSEYQRTAEYGAKLALRSYIDEATNAAKLAERAITSSFKSMENALTQFVMTGKLDFKSLADSIIADFVRIQIQRAITLPLANWAAGLLTLALSPASTPAFPLGSGDLVGVNANVAHTGGLLGGDLLPGRQVSAAHFAQARRFHTGGLVAGEVPIIAREGEAVFTPGQLRALGGMAGGTAGRPAVNVQVNVINRASGIQTRVEEQQQADGSTRLDVIVEKIEAYMSRSIAIGSGLAPTLERRYGLNPAAGVYR